MALQSYEHVACPQKCCVSSVLPSWTSVVTPHLHCRVSERRPSHCVLLIGLWVNTSPTGKNGMFSCQDLISRGSVCFLNIVGSSYPLPSACFTFLWNPWEPGYWNILLLCFALWGGILKRDFHSEDVLSSWCYIFPHVTIDRQSIAYTHQCNAHTGVTLIK